MHPDTITTPTRRLRPWHLAGLLLAGGVLALMVYAFWPEASAGEEARRPGADSVAAATSPVDVAIVQAVDFPLRTEATGHLQPRRRAEISAEGQGVVRERRVEVGDYVEEGAVLLVLATSDAQNPRYVFTGEE